MLVAPDNPVALGLAGEIGVNTYVTVTLPGIIKVQTYVNVEIDEGLRY